MHCSDCGIKYIQ